MSTEITKAFVQQYKNNVEMLVRQQGSRLRNAVRVEQVTGEKAFFEQIGSAAAQARTSRHSDTPILNTEHARRMVLLADYEWGDLIDNQDKVRTLIDPTGPYSIAAADALGAAMDQAIIAAAFGSSLTGTTGSTSIALPSTQKVVVNNHSYDSGSGDVGLSVGKLQAAKQILMANEVNPSERMYVAANSMQLMKLLKENEVRSADYNTVKALVNGEISTFMGFHFIHSEQLGVDANADHRVLVWAESGLLLALGQDINVKIQERADKAFATQVYASMTIGSTRMQEKKVVEIACDPA